jgi:hypothetical protein
VAGWSVCASAPFIPSQLRSGKAFLRSFVGVCGWVFCAKNWQLNKTQKQLDQLKLEQQLNRVQQELKLNAIAREQNPLRRQEQIRALQLQQHMQFLQEQSRTKLMQQDLNR